MNYKNIIKELKLKGISFEQGLSNQEVKDIESTYDFIFTPDLKEFLMTALPVNNDFINWRDKSVDNINSIKSKFIWPLEGIVFDIEHNNFWFESWGSKPNSLEKAIAICRNEFLKVPKLIPIYSHRYISSEPNEPGNPIISVYQTDIIYYGENLLSYLEVEFNLKNRNEINFDSIKKIRFWDHLAS